jgi:hypothetical protein
MSEKRIYRPVPDFTYEQIKSAIAEDKVDLLKDIAFAVGYHSTDWKYSQDICLQLSGHSDKAVREMAILGLFYVAIFQKKLDKRLVKPVLLRALKDSEVEVRERAEYVVPEINRALDWNIADYHKKEKTIGREDNVEDSFSTRSRSK